MTATKINKLTLQGFKSFRKRLSIPLFSGFNVFCGPNGSGKTNICDAIAFALGRSSTKSLRADRLHELVYHGFGSIPPSEQASVTIWLDNSNSTLPFETQEVSIKRKVNTKGNSIYKINERTMTREKVLEFLNSIGINPDGYNIIMQGDVNQVLEMTSQERREIIDEISGIAHYNEKKGRAQANLDKVDAKLKEVEIVISERMERLQELEADRNAALKYKDLTEKLNTLRASLSYKRFTTLESEFKNSEKVIEESEGEIGVLEEEIGRLEQEIEKYEKKKEGIAEKMYIRSRKTSIRAEIDDLNNRIIRNQNKIEINNKEMERLNKMIERLDSISERRGIFSKAVQTILDMGRQGVHGTVSKLIRVPKEYEICVEVAGGNRLQNIVVDNSAIAAENINFLKRERVGRATFLPLNRIRGSTLNDKSVLKKAGVIGLVSDAIRYENKYSPAISHVFGDTIIVENLGVARELGISRYRMVTLDGDLTEKSGAMIGGYYQKRDLVGADSEINELERNKREIEEENNFLQIEIDQLSEKIGVLKKKEEGEAKEVVGLEDERTEAEKAIEEMKMSRREKYEHRLNLQNKINRLKIKTAKTEAELENSRIEVEKYGKVEYIDDKLEVLESQISSVISQLNALGLVNMKAIEEYDAFKVEFDELKGKYDRVCEEKRAIQEMIERIEEKKKEVFYETLRGINKNFIEIFAQMTGGAASLELEDSMNIESGLAIKASPKGKTLLNIDAMSGGEKSITALAFLFGIQKFKPAPFYILDEVDAFLDKVNTKKAVDMIKRLSEMDQFIIITHNDYTIKQGDRVYGVSLENGESKILGLELPG